MIILRADRDVLALVVNVMQYFAEATNILQAEGKPTSNSVIPVVDSLENTLKTINRDHMAINALCEHLLNSLEQCFGYLKDSPLHQAATVLDPNINLSFTDNNEEGKVFTFTSSEVKRSVKGLLPESAPLTPGPSTVARSHDDDAQPKKKKPRLMDFCSIPKQPDHTLLDIDIELQTYFDQPHLKQVNPIKY